MNLPVAIQPTISTPVSLGERWRMLQRRRWPALYTAASVIALSSAAALLWPPTYRSTGTILIEQQELPSNLVESTITSFADQRIQQISQRVMTTDNLTRIIQRYDLYATLRARQPREVVLEHMRKDVHFQMISADVMDPREGRATKANIAFSVSYDNRSPETAARVANELVSLYLDENVRERRQQATDAATFLAGQSNRLDQSIKALQAQIAQYKDKHINTLPDQATLNNELLMRTEDELRDVETQLRTLAEESTFLDAQLAQISPSSQVYTSTGERVLSPSDRLKFLRTQYAQLSAIYAPGHPDVVRTKREIEGLEQAVGQVDSSNDLARQLEDARGQLATLQKRYAPDYPDVTRLQQEVKALEQTIADNAKRRPVVPTVATPDNPAYIQIKAQREAADAQRSSLQQKRAELAAKVTALEARLAEAPAVERDYSAMLRSLENQQLEYREVQGKQLDAQLAQNLEDQQKGERFTLIDPPLVPELPASPNRWLIVAFGLVLALAAAAGAVLVLEGRDHSVRNRYDLEALLQVAPLVVLPRLVTQMDRRRRRQRRLFAFSGAVGGLGVTLLMVHLLYRPLDVLWEVALRKLGG
jgi:uncharacterized protein involved in exopolysaccharide biosynthesis